jgi:hypothetical protein
VVVAEVDDGVGARGAGAERVEIVEAAAMDLGAERRDLLGRVVGAGEAEHLVPGGEQLGYDRRSDPAGCSGDEDTHGEPPGEE